MPEKNTEQDDNLEVRIRMYCHGLGDCFLLRFKKGTQEFNMLIDCGVLQRTKLVADPAKKRTEDISEAQLMQRVAENIRDVTKNHLNLVAVTHEHHDHICGFGHAGSIFDSINFDDVWLAWTEDPMNELARSLHEKKELQLQGIQTALDKMKLYDKDTYDMIDNLLARFAGDTLAAAKENKNKSPKQKKKRANGLDYILNRKEKKTHQETTPPQFTYCYPGREPLHLKGFEEDIRVFVLGPPDSLEKLKDLNAPATEKYRHFSQLLIGSGCSAEDSFFMALSGNNDEITASAPFNEDVGIDEKQAREDESSFFYKNYYSGKSEDWRTIDADWLATASEVALKLDSYTNNTSLVLAIELIKSKKVLLFVGDAQFGNWESWHDYEWKIPDDDGKEKTVKTEDLLKRTVVYKVGHHGSHNATLKEHGLEMMSSVDELVALIPVDTNLALSQRPHKWEMPFSPLLEDLQKKTNGRVVASDRGRLTEFLPGTANEEWNSFEIDEEDLLFGEKLFIDYVVK